MSILFKGREQGAYSSKIGVIQRIQMFFITHVRQALASLGELWRQPAASLMTIGVLGLSITLPSTLYILVKNTESVSAGWEQASEISLFLEDKKESIAILDSVVALHCKALRNNPLVIRDCFVEDSSQ